MSRKTRQQKSSRSPVLAALSVILLAIAAIVSQLTGVDLIGTLMGAATSTPLPPTAIADVRGPEVMQALSVNKGFGATKNFWQVYFNAAPVSQNRADYNNGVEMPLAAAIGAAQATLDIATFEWNSPALTQAVLDAHARGVAVRIVADNEHTIEDPDTTLDQLVDAGIPVVYDQKSALMHNKFMVIDGSTVWVGSMNYTINDIYRNNNNIVALRSRRAAEAFTAEFNEMFVNREFSRKRSGVDDISFTQNGTPVRVMFAPEGDVADTLIETLNGATTSIKFMAFSFTLENVAEALLRKAQSGVTVEGVFELIGADTSSSRLRQLRCAGLDARIDGNPYRLHHKVFIIDDRTVVFGSFNFSANASNSNDENMVIITDPDLAGQFVAEYNRIKQRATAPQIACQ